MTILIIIGVVFIVYLVAKANNSGKKPSSADSSYSHTKQNNYQSYSTSRGFNNNPTNYKDNSIIDISPPSNHIISCNGLKKYNNGVPYWAYQYVYSYNEINYASDIQKNFYSIFRNKFINGECLDLEGNNNYAFILLFDLLNQYNPQNDNSVLERQIKTLGQYYPKTKSYGISFLVKKMETFGNYEQASQVRENNEYFQNYYYDYDYWRLGRRYKDKLKLNDEEVKLLNKLWHPNNNFANIEFCLLEILKLYISVIAGLKNKYKEENTTLDAEFSIVADIIARKHFKYRNGSQNYKYSIESSINELYVLIFKHCENAVREYYGHKRKLNTDAYFFTLEPKTEYDNRILSKVQKILPAQVVKLNKPDEATDKNLYTQNTTRWKIKFEELTKNYNGNPKGFFEEILILGKLNQRNPSVENIFFEASKFITKYNREYSLSFYMYYLYYDLQSSKFDNKQFTKTIQKSLFATNEQLHDFEAVVSELINSRDLEKALQSVPKIYEVKRKKIKLDKSLIQEAAEQHSETVEILNEYLQDEYEDVNNSIKTYEISKDEVEIKIISKTEDVKGQLIYDSNLMFNQLHAAALQLFEKNNFSILQDDFEIFAKSKGAFRNQLIESINEICYECLDDVLIEEEDEYYTINTDYYQTILIK